MGRNCEKRSDSTDKRVLEDLYPDMPSTIEGLQQTICKISPESEFEIFHKSFINILEYLNDSQINLTLLSRDNDEDPYTKPIRTNIITNEQFIFFTIEYLLFTQFQDADIRKIIQMYRKQQFEKFSKLSHYFDIGSGKKSGAHLKNKRLADLAYLMLYDDFDKTKSVLSVKNCHIILNHLFSELLGLKFPKLRAFKNTLNAYEK